MQVFTTHPLHPIVAGRLRDMAEYKVASSPTEAAILSEGTEADVLIVRAPIPEVFFDRAPSLRAAIRHGAGLDMIPVPAATRAGVLVANAPGANAQTVAEHAIFSAIALLRRFREMDHALRGAGWSAGRAFADHGRDLSDRTLGILGMGNVGRALARIAGQGFGMRVLATTRTPSSLPAGVEGVGLDDLAARSDVLVLCCPLTEETRGALSSRRIASMKPGAILVNVARGPVVDKEALIGALAAGRLGGAALDVFDQQPLPPDHPLFGLPNVILTPHMAGITDDSMLRMGTMVAVEVERVLAGKLPLNFCNPEVEPAYRRRFPA